MTKVELREKKKDKRKRNIKVLTYASPFSGWVFRKEEFDTQDDAEAFVDELVKNTTLTVNKVKIVEVLS